MILSKKEIKETLNPSVLFAIQRKVCLYARVAVEELLKYTEKLETENTALKKRNKYFNAKQKKMEKQILQREKKTKTSRIKQAELNKQKLIEKLEEDVINITKVLQDGKHSDDYSRCRLKSYRTKTKEILKILKGENDE